MIFSKLLSLIQKNLDNILDELGCQSISFTVELAKPGFGDITCNASFLLAKHLKQKPSDIAKTLSDKYETYLDDHIVKVEAHPSGYLNFFLNQTIINKTILNESIQDDYGSIDLGYGNKITVEHTSVNPNKALHIGHVRNIVIGDTIARILQKANYSVNVLNYIDDSGLQVADIIVGFKYLNFPETSEQKFDHYCGDEVYVKTTEQYSTNPDLEEKRKQVLKELEDGTSEIAEFGNKITRQVLDEQLKTCWRLNVTYDCLNFESQIIRSGLWKNIFEKMKTMQLLEFETGGKNAQCWVIRGEENEDDKVVVRSNGTATYIAKDIPYAAWKLGLIDDPFGYSKYATQENNRILWQTTLEKNNEPKQNFSSDKVITVIDSRQSRLQKIITTLMAKFKSSDDAYVHLGYESVTLSADTAKTLGIDTQGKQAQMSGRKGLYVNADSVLDLLQEKTSEETKKRNPDINDVLLQKLAKDVAVAALRYEMIKQDLDKIITFDLTKSLSMEGDTAPYIQYAFARASRILEKASIEPNFDAVYEKINNDYEISLVREIGKFDLQLRDAAKNLSPKVIAKYSYDLAVAFNGFYEHVKVLDSQDNELINARLCLVSSFVKTISKVLNLLGIESPEKM